MRRLLMRAVVAVALVAAGWAIARAQTTDPAFEIQVDVTLDGSGTGAKVSCVNGCSLAWVERGLNPNSRATSTFSFSCKSASGTPAACSSGRVGGWLH